MFKFLLITIGIVAVSSRTTENQVPSSEQSIAICNIPIGSYTRAIYWPLAFHLNGSLYSTDTITNDIQIPTNTELYLSCGPNYLKLYDRTEFIKVKCTYNNGKFLTSTTNQLKSAADLKCDLRVIEEIIHPVTGCPKTHNSGQFGYIHPIDQTTQIIGESCYNTDEGKTYFVHIQLGGDDQQSIFTELIDRKFFYRQQHPSSRYRIDFLKAIRLDQFNERLRNTLSIPDSAGGGGVELPGYQMAAFVDSVFAANRQFRDIQKLVWNSFAVSDDCVGNMDLVKQDIVQLADAGKVKGNKLDIYTGSHGVTQLPNTKTGIKVPIYLDDDEKRFPIPELIWTLIRDGQKATVIGVFNSPAVNNQDIKSPCKLQSKCDQITWLVNVKKANLLSRTDVIVCCEYSVFQLNVPEMPNLIGITEFLK